MASLTDWYLAMWLPTTSSGFLKVITSGFDFLPGATSKPSRVKSSRSMRICAFLEMADAVEAALAAEQPVDRDAGEGARPRHQVGVVLDAGKRPVEAGDQRFQRVLRGVEQEVGLGDVVRRLALAVDQLQQIGGKAEGRNVSRRRQQLLEGAWPRRLRAARARSWPAALSRSQPSREHVGDGERHLTGRGGRGTAACAGRSPSADRRGGSRRRSWPARPRGCGAPSRSTPSRRSGGRCRRAPCRTGRRNPPARRCA